jgi:hypothetical protein
MDKAQRAEFIRRASFISEASRDERAAFVDEIAQAAAPQPRCVSSEREAAMTDSVLAWATEKNVMAFPKTAVAHLQGLAGLLQSRAGEETCSYLVQCLAKLANDKEEDMNKTYKVFQITDYQRDVIKEALGACGAGLDWYRDQLPHLVDGSDDEMEELFLEAYAIVQNLK